MIYQQTLYKVLKDHVKQKTIDKLNRYKKWEYGYNKEHDVVVISKTGKIGEIYEIQNLKIALPLTENCYKYLIKKKSSVGKNLIIQKS